MDEKEKAILCYFMMFMFVGALGGYATNGDLQSACGGAVLGFIAGFFLISSP